MTGNEFIFIKKTPQRYIRHVVFWISWWGYFYGGRYFYPKPLLASQRGILQIRKDNINHVLRAFDDYWDTAQIWGANELIRSLLMVCVHVISCYILIYFLFPRFLLKAEYFLFLLGTLLLVFLMILSSRFVDTGIMTAVAENWNGADTPFYASIFEGVVNAIKIMAAASAIKLGKYWWLKQKEKRQLEKEKTDTELQLLKAHLHPEFLFGALNIIYSSALTASPNAPEMLLRLSDILSYTLYDCNDEEVLLNKEIKMLVDYITFEQLKYNDKLEMTIRVTHDDDNDVIAPFLLLQFIQHSFRQSSSHMIEQAWINFELHVKNHLLEMKLLNGKAPFHPEDNPASENAISLARRMLDLFYPNKYALKITEEPEIMIVTLTLQLRNSTEIQN